MLSGAALRPNRDREEAVESAWAGLVTSGPLLSSTERIGVIEVARAAWAGNLDVPDTPGYEAAHWLARDAGGLTEDVVARFEAAGLDRMTYLEVVGVVARLSNIDFYARGIGAPLPPLPAPDDSAPTGIVSPDATMAGAWVPTVGRMAAPLVLDALPHEGKALRAIHEPMYIPMAEIGNGGYEDDLNRLQIEYLASRTSFLNECFY